MKVSKKGQIVVPANLRERLNLEPGMEVKFSIRGQILQVEIEHNVQEDIGFLENLKGNLGEADFDEHQMGEIIRDLLSQQFYNGNDMLTDRVGRSEYQIRGSDSIIQETVNILVHSGRHWFEGEYADTFLEYCELFELDFATIISNFNTKIKGLTIGGQDMIKLMGGEVIFAMCIGEVLTQFRTRVGDETQEKILREADILGYAEKLGDETVEEKIISGLADRYSILMNLRVLRELARVSIKTIGARLFDKISDELLSEFENMEMPNHIKKRIERRHRRAAKARGETYVKKDISSKRTADQPKDDKPAKEVILPGMPNFDFGPQDETS